jgi:hypothetical protein
MYIWIVAFAYDELSGIVDAGVLFYQMDFWSLWNLAIIVVGGAFVIASESNSNLCCLASSASLTGKHVTGVIGLGRQDNSITDLSFDILSLEALFLVPRYDSLKSLLEVDLPSSLTQETNRICSLVSLNSYFGSLVCETLLRDHSPLC